jgi:YVTN family beta-propeller protein
MAVSPDGKTVYVALGRDNAVGVVNVASRMLKAKIPAGIEPAQVAVSPDGKTLYVSNETTAMVTAIDVASGSTVFSVTVGAEPEGVAVTPDGQSVYVASAASGTVAVLDARSGQRRTDLAVGAKPRFVAFTHDGAYAVITSEAGGSVTVVDLPKNVVLKTVSVGAGDSSRPSGLVFSPDDETAYLASGADRILLFSMSALAVTDTIAVAGRPGGVALDGAGAILYSADSRSNQLSVVDVVHDRLLRTINVGERPYAVVMAGSS